MFCFPYRTKMCFRFLFLQFRERNSPYCFIAGHAGSQLPCHPFSTLLQQKLVPKPILRQKAKVKLKAKPYEELLKVLEIHEQALEVKDPSVPLNKTKTKNVILNRDGNLVSSHGLGNPDTDLGIYTVQKLLSSKKRSKPQKTSETPSSDEHKSKKRSKSESRVKMATNTQMLAQKEELEIAAKHAYAMRTLKSYIEVSVNANEVEKAQHALEYYQQKNKAKGEMELRDIDLYNLLISGWSRKGRLDKVKHLFSMMSHNNVVPNVQSYAGYLECIARSQFIDFAEIQNVVQEMRAKGLTCQDIFHKCVFVADQREKVIEVLGFVDSELFQPSRASGPTYSCRLLQPLNDPNYEKGDTHLNFCFQREDIEPLSMSQLQLEENHSLKIQSVDALAVVNDKVLKSRKYLAECEDMWKKKLTTALKNIKNLEKKSHSAHRPSIYPYLAVIDTDILVNLLLREIRLLAETGEFFSPNVKILYRELGIKVMNHYYIWLNKHNKITDKVCFIYQRYLSFLLDPELFHQYTPRQYWEFLKEKHFDGPSLDVAQVPWPHSVLTYIGRYLYDILRYNISFNANCVRHKVPSKVMSQAFYTAYEGLDVKLSKQIRTHSLLCKLYRDARLDHLEFDVSLVPMLSPPRPWVKHDSGGLLTTPIPFIRYPGHAQHQVNFYATVPPQQLNPCFDSLNSLSLCPWVINKPLLDLVIEVFRAGGREDLEIPLNPSSLPSAPKINSSMSKKEKTAVRRQKNELKKKKGETTSLWFDCLYKLSIANHFRDKIFWFPHNLDFRGRVYPTPPHFNHLGNDMARSILLFADGKPLGPKGFDWLKIHLVNLTGFKKRDPHDERLRYANEMMPEILDSADHPFDGNQWWKSSDKPWQTLACCKEVAAASRHPRPEEYVSHFPVHQDGSCNGLQHYAALGRDELGAIEVNLHPSDCPQDVYSGVAALVEKERQKDAANDIEIAKYLEGFVKRKVVKQTVMTFVYGVTTYGAKLQILKQLKDVPEYSEKHYHEGATYLMKKTFLSIREMFTATKQIQDWFTDCAEQITRVSGDTLEWVTPLGFPVVQPYHKEASVRSSKYCLSQGKDTSTHYTSKYEPYQLPNIKKQKNAFAPNFIHSLDSSHMMLTSLFCHRKSILFVSVHDCYWTHASTVEIMNKICREQFVSLHKEPILENLSAFFLEKYARVVDKNIQSNKTREKSARVKLRDILSKVPEKGTFDLDKVLESIYFFS